MTTRRTFVASSVAAGLVPTALAARQDSSSGDLMEELVIDLSGSPDHLTPATSYSTRDWSVIHSIYDSLVDFGPDGTIQPQAAEVFETDDAVTFRVKLREGMTFHDGSPVTTAAITRNVQHIRESDTQISELYDVITEVREIDDLNAEIICSEPAVWLPSQMVVWGTLLPENFSEESLATSPVGSGPYIFEEWVADSHISLVRNPDYPPGLPKGDPMAERVIYRFVPEASTRVADLSSGQAQIIAEIPHDQIAGIEQGGNTAITSAILGTAFIRIASDTEPFNDPRVAQALNYAVDVESIASALVSPEARRLASVFPDPRGIGFDEALDPFPFDPERARELLAEAGLADGVDGEIQAVAGSRIDVVEAVVAQLAEVGVRLNIVTTELAGFNQDWPNDQAPVLRYATWRPMYDPFTFLRLVVSSGGFLSRYDNPVADELILSGAIEPNPTERNAIYQELGRELQEHPAAIYLWNLVSTVGVANIEGWQPRGDEYVLPLRRIPS